MLSSQNSAQTTTSKTSKTHTTCCYCGVGCGIVIEQDRQGRLSLSGDPDHPGSQGQLCSKGRSLLQVPSDDRLLEPQMRNEAGELQNTDWDSALDAVAQRFLAIRDKHGPDSVAFYVSGQMLTEEYYLANKLMKGYIGSNNIDTNSRLCMSSAVMGYKLTLGADAPPFSYDDFDDCDTFLISGANPAWCHPIIYQRIEERLKHPDACSIVIDPRRTPTAEAADLHLQLRPGSDVWLHNALAKCLLDQGDWDFDYLKAHVDGWEDFQAFIQDVDLEEAAQECGVPLVHIKAAAERLGGKHRFMSLWAMGLNQSAIGVDKNISLIQLSLLTGKIGQPGCGPASLTGQPNAMGGREVGGMATLASAHRNLANPAHRQEIADFWGVDEVPAKPGLTAVEMVEAAERGELKAIWIMCTNPVASLPSGVRVDEAFAKLDCLVVQDIYPTETSELADIVLPAATWLEKTGTMTNSDRRITLLEPMREVPGNCRPDTDILQDVANRMGFAGFNYQNCEEIFLEHCALTKGQDCDVSGLTYQRLRDLRSAQWPVPNLEHEGTPRLYTDGQFATENGRAKVHCIGAQAIPSDPDRPFILTTGRLRDQWHYGTRTARVNKLTQHQAHSVLDMHPLDAAENNLKAGDVVTVSSEDGEVQVPLRMDDGLRRGVVFLPMHWGKQLGGQQGRTNNVTSTRRDAKSQEPDFKFTAVSISPALPEPRRILIVGAGVGALQIVKQAHQHGSKDQFIILGAEPEDIYNRVQLPHYIDHSQSWDDLVLADGNAIDDFGATLMSNCQVTAIDRKQRQITLADGSTQPYDKLILATGSRPRIACEAPESAPVHSLRSRQDAEHINRLAQPGAQAVIVGGGVLGLELADSLRHRDCQVTVLQRSHRLMGRMLDDVAAEHLAEELRDRGITIKLSCSIADIAADGLCTLNDGTSIAADLIVTAAGTVPNDDLAREAGLSCDTGVLVNDQFTSDDPDIFALGECAQTPFGRVGTTASVTEQATIVIEHLRGNGQARYTGSTDATIVKVHGLQLAAAGEVDPPADDDDVDIIMFHDRRKHHYHKCVLRDDKLVGVILMGDIAGFDQYHQWISSGLELDQQRDQLLRPGGSSQAVDGELICSCNQVGSNTILTAAENCNADLDQLCQATKAGTTCGSCRGEVRKLMNQVALSTATATAT